ncbi:MAG: hypothetical protein HN910_09310 [Porticoccaceae bacterium]|nr:hypothetical protein [Candidatus Neomarinimicrobiota bacterium]MBT7168983.1 hypothetical protein [Porticoccaceae bacterium]
MSNELIGLFDVDWMPTSAWRLSAKDLALSHNLPTKQMTTSKRRWPLNNIKESKK